MAEFNFVSAWENNSVSKHKSLSLIDFHEKTFSYTFQVFSTRYKEMHMVQDAKCAISKLKYGSSMCMDNKHSLKLVAHRLVHTDEPYINLH